MSHDLLIIGGGLGGLAAASRAAELGLKPLVLEPGAEVDYPCNTRFAGGIIHVAQKEMRAPVEDVKAAIEALTGGAGDTQLGELLAEECGRALDWMRGEGAKFIKGGVLEFMRWVLAPPRPRRPGLDWKGRGPDVMLRNLTSRIEERGGTIRRGVRAREIVLADGRVVGVRAERQGETETIEAAAVVIADGGFQGDPELVKRFITSRPEGLFTRGAGTGCGDGLRMAEAAGAALLGTDRFYGHLLGREAFGNEMLWPYPTVDAIAQVSVLVDSGGRRFADEGVGGVYMANELARLTDPLSAAVVFDDAVWTGLAADNRYPPCMNPSFVKEGGTVFEADDLAGLADMIGVEPDGLAETVTAHNRAVEAGGWAELAPARATDKFPPQPIATKPFRAIQVCAGMTYTMGGIAIDRDSRALKASGAAIEGLYAVGSSTGGMEGGPSAAYLGGLAKAVITGLRAAEAIVAESSS